jgi:OPT family oligopeptide transporter
VGLVWIGAASFAIPPLLGVVAVLLAFLLAIVACRVTGETDTTPAGPLGKIAQLTFGVLLPQQLVANVATACITAGAGTSAADLMMDFKTGHLLGVQPRQQFLAQLAGCVVGTVVMVPAFYTLVPDASALGGATFPAPAARVWRGVAEALANGLGALHPTARLAVVVAAAVGVIVTVVDDKLPQSRRFLPSPVGFGFAFVLPISSSLSFFLGAVAARLVARRWPAAARTFTLPVAAGGIAGESLVGVAIAWMRAAGWLL